MNESFTGGRRSFTGGRNAALMLAAAVAVPFVVTAMFRVAESIPTVVPFLVLAALGVTLWLVRPRLRSIAAGILVGTLVYAALLAYVLDSWGRGLSNV